MVLDHKAAFQMGSVLRYSLTVEEHYKENIRSVLVHLPTENHPSS